jgi:hypothetical protein
MVSKLKRLSTDWEKICQLYIIQWIDNQTIQGAQKTSLKKVNDQMRKWRNELKRVFSKKEI